MAATLSGKLGQAASLASMLARIRSVAGGHGPASLLDIDTASAAAFRIKKRGTVIYYLPEQTRFERIRSNRVMLRRCFVQRGTAHDRCGTRIIVSRGDGA
jgi:hypothetical protein